MSSHYVQLISLSKTSPSFLLIDWIETYETSNDGCCLLEGTNIPLGTVGHGSVPEDETVVFLEVDEEEEEEPRLCVD